MDPKNSNHEQDQAFPLATTETLRPLVQLFLAQLTAAQWAGVGSGALDEKTEDAITELCVNLVNTMSTCIFHLFNTHLAHLKSTEVISEEEVQQFLGDSITETFESVTGGEIPRKSARKVKDIVTREVTERINSQLSNHSEGSKVSEPQATKGSKFSRRLKVMVKHVARMLKDCRAKVPRATSDLSVDSQSGETAGTSQSLLEISQIPAASQGLLEVAAQVPEEIAAAESFITRTTEAVTKILSEQASRQEVEYNADISEEEQEEITSSINKDTNEAASDITSFIWSHREAFGLKRDGSPKSEQANIFVEFSGYDPDISCIEDRDISDILNDTDYSDFYVYSSPTLMASSSRTKCWNVLSNKIKTFFIRKFMKEAVVSCIAKLRNKLNRFSAEKTPLGALVPAATEVVEALIPPDNQEKCVYREMALCIHNDENELVSKELGKVILDNIRPDNDCVRTNRTLVEVGVESFMKKVWDFVILQIQQRSAKNRVKVSLEQIKQLVIDFPKKEPEEPAPPTTTVEFDVSDDEEEEISVTPVKESKPLQGKFSLPPLKESKPLPTTAGSDVSDDEEEEEISIEPIKESKPLQGKFSLPPLKESKPLPSTAGSDVSDDEEEEEISIEPLKESKPLPTTAGSDVSDDEEEEEISIEPIKESKPLQGKFSLPPLKESKPLQGKFSLPPLKESKPLPTTAGSDVSDDEEEEEISVTPIKESKPLQGKFSLPPIKESKPLPSTAEIEVSDDEEDELIDEEDDTPEVVPPNVTAKQPQSTEREDLFYVSMVSALLNQIVKNVNTHITLSNESIANISSALTLMLCTKLAGSDFVKPSGDKIKKTVRAVHEELCKKMGSKGTLAINLLSQSSPVYECVTETIKRHLVKPKKTGVKGFFNSFFKIVSKPFRACCTHG
ncbi:hypothetical protein GBF38_000236 [Nibea albiflora]|nr:hypothetical protein GBF38_000236 [Nibea albiflora]